MSLSQKMDKKNVVHLPQCLSRDALLITLTPELNYELGVSFLSGPVTAVLVLLL